MLCAAYVSGNSIPAFCQVMNEIKPFFEGCETALLITWSWLRRYYFFFLRIPDMLCRHRHFIIHFYPSQTRSHFTAAQQQILPYYGFPILNGVVIGQNIGRHIVGVVYHPVGVHVVEVVLEIRQKQGAHAHRVNEHILSALNVEESDIDAEADEPIRALDLMGAHILRQKQFAAVLEKERLTGRIQLRQGVQKVGVQVGPLQRRKRRRQHIGGHHLIPALPEDPLPILLRRQSLCP